MEIAKIADAISAISTLPETTTNSIADMVKSVEAFNAAIESIERPMPSPYWSKFTQPDRRRIK